MRSAGRYALGAVAAYISIDQARIAIETTQELARTTTNLSESFGLSTKMASGFSAVAKARGIDAASLTMSFKTLSTQIENAKEGSESSVSAFNKLGISMGELKSLNTDQLIMRITEGFGKMSGSTGKAAVMSQLLGRGFSRLGFLFRDGKVGLQEYMKMAEQSGAIMSDLEKDKITRLNRAMLSLKLSQMGLYKSFALAMTPALEAAAQQLTKFTRILSDPKLSNSQKFRKISDEITNLVTKAIPPAIAAMGRQAPKIAAAFVQGFINAPVWGKLAMGAYLITKFGGVGAFFKFGQGGGRAMGLGIAAGIALSYPEIKGMVDRMLKAILPDDLVNLANKIPNPFTGFKSANTVANDVRNVRKSLFEMATQSGKSGRALGAMGKAGRQAANTASAGAKRVQGSLGGVARSAERAAQVQREGFRRAWSSISSSAQSGSRRVNTAQGNIATKSRSSSNQSKSAWSTLGGVFDTLVGKASSLLGVLGSIASKAASIPGKVAGLFQRGGPIPGTGSGDRIPAMLEPGEFVLNREAVKAYGMDTLHAMNYAVPRFATGGIVQRLKRGGKASKKDRPKPPKPKPIPRDELGRLEADLAGAELTYDTTTDDKSALIGLINYWKRIAAGPPMKKIQYGKPIWNEKKKHWEYKEKKVIDYDKLTQARNAQNSYQQQLQSIMEAEAPEPVDTGGDTSGDTGTSSGSADTSEADNNLAELNTQLQIMVSNQRSLLNVSQSQYGVLVQALAAAVSGHIGGKIGLGSQAPAVAGRLASY